MENWLDVIIISKDNKAGDLVAYNGHQIWFYDDGTPDPFMFSEGNFSCDCNRFLLHERAKGNNPPMNLNNCGGDGYSVDLYRADTLECVYSEREKGVE